MAITSTGYNASVTSANVAGKPSILDRIIMLGAVDTPIMTKIGRSTAGNYKHGWITDQIAAPRKNAQLEISDFSGSGASTKQLTENAVQIFTTDVMVSRDAQARKVYGGNELAHETGKKAKEHGRDIEYSLLGLGRGSDATAAQQRISFLKAPAYRAPGTDKGDYAAETAGEMAGLGYYVAGGALSADGTNGANWTQNTNHGRKGNFLTFATDGSYFGWLSASTYSTKATLTADIFNQILQVVWDGGESPVDIFVGANLKGAINKFATRQISNEKAIVTQVTSIDTDFGKVNLNLHRFLTDTYGLGDVLIAGNFDYMKLAPLVSTSMEDVPSSKTATCKRYYTSATSEVTNKNAFVIAGGLKA